MIPSRYQGLGLPNMALEKLSESLLWLQRHWDVKEGVGLVVREAYECLQMETGLSGNIFQRNYKRFQSLATHTWYKIFWEYLYNFNVRIELSKDLNVPIVRERDVSLMDIIVDTIPSSEWVAFNRVRKHKHVFFISQLLHCDGVCVIRCMLGAQTGPLSTMVFSYEEPTKEDFRLWERVLRLITSPTLRRSPPLGRFIRLPYERFIWFTNNTRSLLARKDITDDTYLAFLPATNSRNTRGGMRYSFAQYHC